MVYLTGYFDGASEEHKCGCGFIIRDGDLVALGAVVMVAVGSSCVLMTVARVEVGKVVVGGGVTGLVVVLLLIIRVMVGVDGVVYLGYGIVGTVRAVAF